MASNKVHIPSGTAGITSYSEGTKSVITFQPGHIILLSIVIIALILTLHAVGAGWITQ